MNYDKIRDKTDANPDKIRDETDTKSEAREKETDAGRQREEGGKKKFCNHSRSRVKMRMPE